MGTDPGGIDSPIPGPDWALGRPWPRFLIDQNHPPVFGPAFRIVGYNVVSARELALDREDDLELIRRCGEENLVWVTEDVDARRRGEYAALVQVAKVSAVFLRPPAAKGWSVKAQVRGSCP